jgi:hypothetical protein
MDPKKKRGLIQMTQPAERVINNIFSASLDGFVPICTAPPEVKAGIIHLETAIKARSGAVKRIENDRPNESSGVIPVLLEQVWEIWQTGRKRNPEINDPIVLRVSSREQSRV